MYLIYDFIKYKRQKYLLLVLLLIFIASQIKFEGVFISLLFLFIPMKLRLRVIFFTIAWIPTISWILIYQKLGIPSDIGFVLPNLNSILSRTFIIFHRTFIESLNYRNWYNFWPLFLIIMILVKTKSSFVKLILHPGLFFMVIPITMVYLFSSLDTLWYVSNSIDRILLQLTPFIYLIFVERVGILINKLKI